jgi:hypothetical protein
MSVLTAAVHSVMPAATYGFLEQQKHMAQEQLAAPTSEALNQSHCISHSVTHRLLTCELLQPALIWQVVHQAQGGLEQRLAQLLAQVCTQLHRRPDQLQPAGRGFFALLCLQTQRRGIQSAVGTVVEVERLVALCDCTVVHGGAKPEADHTARD